jgi:hypothetical protein
MRALVAGIGVGCKREVAASDKGHSLKNPTQFKEDPGSFLLRALRG